MQREIHFCGIERRWYTSGWRYFAKLCLSGKPPVKTIEATGEVLHPLGYGDVGNDIGPQTLATVGDNQVQLAILADNVEDLHGEIRRIKRKMDRSRKMHNPQFFNEDGTVIPKDKLPPELLTVYGKRKWTTTNNYRCRESKLRSLYRSIAEQREQAHHELVNKLLSFGDVHYIEHMNWSALKKRTKEDHVNGEASHAQSDDRAGLPGRLRSEAA